MKNADVIGVRNEESWKSKRLLSHSKILKLESP